MDRTDAPTAGMGTATPRDSERPKRRTIDCAGNPEIADRQHIVRGGRDLRLDGAHSHGSR